MTRIAQVIAAILVLVLGGAGIVTMFSPLSISEAAGFAPDNNYAITNVRTLGAPTLALAIITILGAIRKEWLLILPASLYFLLNFTARGISVVVEGYEPVMLKGLILTATIFVLSQVVLQSFLRAERR